MLTQLHIIPRRDGMDTSVLALELSFVCKASNRKGNDRKIVPINPVSFENDFEVTSLQSEFHNSIGV
jgi:hypothetical protein